MVFVTGATGFLGRHLVPALLAAGHRVRAFVRPQSSAGWLRTLPVEIASGDVTDRESVVRAVSGCRFVVHAAARFRFWGPPAQFQHTNVTGTSNVCTAAASSGVERFVYISTVAVAGVPRSGRVIDETYPCRPADAYQQSKLDAEAVVLEHVASDGLPAVILRPGAFYGPCSHYGFNRLFFDDPFRGLRIQVHGGQRLTFPVYVPDVAAAIIATLARGRPGETYNVSGESLSHRAVNAIVSRQAGIHPFRLNCPAVLLLGLARAWTAMARVTRREPFYPINLATYVFHDWNVSSRKAAAELGFRATPFEEGARATVAWYREIGAI